MLWADGAESTGEIYGYYLEEHRGQVGGAEPRASATRATSPTPGPGRDGGGTRIDRGLDLAVDVLTGPDRRPAAAPLVVLMSDGRQSDTAPVTAAGDRARGLAIEVFTIGLGEDVDAALLAAAATDPRHYFFAPTEGELAGIYGRIGREIPCR